MAIYSDILIWPLNMAIEIVSFPPLEMVIFHSYVKLLEGNVTCLFNGGNHTCEDIHSESKGHQLS